MATKKINVRSPFYVQVNDQSPPSPTPPTPTATLYQWGGIINYSDTVGTLKTDISSYTEAQLESEFMCEECNGPNAFNNKRSQYGYSQYKSNRLPMQVGDQVYDENGVALTVAATRGTIAYGIENGAVIETGINPCQKSTSVTKVVIATGTGGDPIYKQYLSHIYTWDSSGIVTAVKVPESNCEETNVIPQIPEQTLNCGETTQIGKDIGTRIFNIDARNRTGNFTITHTFRVPVKILITVNGVQTDYGYRGSDTYTGDMIALGVPQSELTNLVSTFFDSQNIVVNRTSEEFPSIKVELRILKQLDEYGAVILANCAADASRNAAPTVSGTTGSLIEGSEAMIVEFYDTYYYNMFKADGDAQWGLEILVNGVVVKTIAKGSLDWYPTQGAKNSKSFVLTNITSTEYDVTPVVSAFPYEAGYVNDKSPVLVNCSSMKKGNNRIGFRFTNDDENKYLKAQQVKVMSTALFYNSTEGTYKWADAYMHYKNGFYGLGTNAIAQSTSPVRNYGPQKIMYLSAKSNQLNELGYEIQKITSTEERHVPFILKSPFVPIEGDNSFSRQDEQVNEGATILGEKYFTHNGTRQGQYFTFEAAYLR